MYRLAVIFAVLAGMLIPATQAHASGYTISQNAAERYAVDAAETKYYNNGVTGHDAICKPQFVSASRKNWKRYTWHRWACVWIGVDGDSRAVYGGMRITGHSDGTYGYMPLFGGLRWGHPFNA